MSVGSMRAAGGVSLRTTSLSLRAAARPMLPTPYDGRLSLIKWHVTEGWTRIGKSIHKPYDVTLPSGTNDK